MSEAKKVQKQVTRETECATIREAAAVLNLTVPALRDRLREWERGGDPPFAILRISKRTTRIPWQGLLRFARGETVGAK